MERIHHIQYCVSERIQHDVLISGWQFGEQLALTIQTISDCFTYSTARQLCMVFIVLQRLAREVNLGELLVGLIIIGLSYRRLTPV